MDISASCILKENIDTIKVLAVLACENGVARNATRAESEEGRLFSQVIKVWKHGKPSYWVLSIIPKIPEISVGIQMEIKVRFSFFLPEY